MSWILDLNVLLSICRACVYVRLVMPGCLFFCIYLHISKKSQQKSSPGKGVVPGFLRNVRNSVVGILLGQTSVIGVGGRYDRAACGDMKQTCREVARSRQRDRIRNTGTQTTAAVEGGQKPCMCGGESPLRT